MRRLLAATILAGCLGTGTPARAQMDSREAIGLQNQILELRRDLQSVQSQRGGGGSLPPPAIRGGGGGGGDISTMLLDRVTTLEEEVRRMRGQMDELANASRRQQEELAKQIADMNFRLQNNAGAPAGRPTAAAAPSPAAAAPEAGGSVRRPPELAMQEGNAALARRDYPTAENAAREVLGGGRGPRATDAQFLLAQSLTGRRDYQGAAIAYDDAYNRSRTGSRAPEALLGIANAMLQLNERGAACASLDKLRSEFSTPRAEIRDGAATLRTRAGCR